MRQVLENPLYYLDNFERVLAWIVERYADLLSDGERAFVTTFSALPQSSRALFVRMVMRKGTLFRASKLNYAEIGCPIEAARHLLPTGWIEIDPVIPLEDLFALLRKPEIATLFQLSLHEQGANKAAQLASLRALYGDARPFSGWYRASGDQLYRIGAKPLCERLRLIFFGNMHQDWTEFVLSDLGVFKYETVEFLPSSRGFRSRRDIDDYLALDACKQRFLAGETLGSLLPSLPMHPFDNDWLDSRRQRLLFQIAQQAEKHKDWDGAYTLYQHSRFPGARARAIRVLEKNARYGQAYALLKQASQAPESAAETQLLQRIAPRLQRQLGQPLQRPRRAPAPASFELSLPMQARCDAQHRRQPMGVESMVREHLAQPGAPVFYVENALINALFGLLCWPAIFSAIPGAFFHPFQRGPTDLFSADFSRRREAGFALCLAELDTHRYRDTIRANFIAKQGVQSPFVAWDALSAELIDLALACIPACHLKHWCAHILQDTKANRSGFPDLIQFWPGELRYQMIEVKGPGDRLQDNQLRWIAFCAEHQMPIAVCYLRFDNPAA